MRDRSVRLMALNVSGCGSSDDTLRGSANPTLDLPVEVPVLEVRYTSAGCTSRKIFR
jgi:hypothetical protein